MDTRNIHFLKDESSDRSGSFFCAEIGFVSSQWPKRALITACWPSTCFFTSAMGNASCGSSCSFAHYPIIRILSIFVFTVAAFSCLIYLIVNEGTIHQIS